MLLGYGMLVTAYTWKHRTFRPKNPTAVAVSQFQYATASNDGMIAIWDANTSGCGLKLQGHRASVKAIASSQSYFASSSCDGTVKVWHTSSGMCTSTLDGHSVAGDILALSHNMTWLASDSGEIVKLWAVESGKCLHTLQAHTGLVTSVAFSHDSSRVVSLSFDCTIKIWSLGSGTCLQMFTGHVDTIWSVSFSHNSTLLASAPWDNGVKIWDTGYEIVEEFSKDDHSDRGRCLHTLEGFVDKMFSLAFSHDSSHMAVGMEHGIVQIWTVRSNFSLCLRTLKIDPGNHDITVVGLSHNSSELAAGLYCYCHCSQHFSVLPCTPPCPIKSPASSSRSS
jgi:WD40 repeat protein